MPNAWSIITIDVDINNSMFPEKITTDGITNGNS